MPKFFRMTFFSIFHHKLLLHPKMVPLFSDALPSGSYFVRDGDLPPRRVYAKTRKRRNYTDKLFADDIWPGAIMMCDHLCSNSDMCKGKRVIELGAGAALPSVVALSLGAARVVATDYPSQDILDNIVEVFNNNGYCDRVVADVCGLSWGDCYSGEESFDVCLLAECLWADTYQLHLPLLVTLVSLLDDSISDADIPVTRDVASVDETKTTEACSLEQCCKKVALVSFAHRPTDSHTKEHDMEFLSLASTQFGMTVTHLKTDVYPDVNGSEGSESTEVHLFSITKP